VVIISLTGLKQRSRFRHNSLYKSVIQMSELEFKQDPALRDFQEYERKLEDDRGLHRKVQLKNSEKMQSSEQCPSAYKHN